MLGGDRVRADDDLGAVGAQHVDLVGRDLVRAHEDALVALLLGHDRQPDAGVAGRRLDDGAAGLERAGALGGLDHAQRDAVLDRPAGVEVLDLGQHGGPQPPGDAVQLHQRRPADQVDHGLGVLHRRASPRGGNTAAAGVAADAADVWARTDGHGAYQPTAPTLRPWKTASTVRSLGRWTYSTRREFARRYAGCRGSRGSGPPGAWPPRSPSAGAASAWSPAARSG